MRETEVVARYEANYGLNQIRPAQVKRHLELERELTAKLLSSTPETRWDVFEWCYDELYAGLPWLSDTGGQDDVGRWTRLVGASPKRIYEVGSGAGLLARALQAEGHTVEATDVSRHRGNRTDDGGLRWSVTDGVNLDRFAESAPYDVVLSDQLVEHLHPDDIGRHCAAACRILKRHGGRYIVRTPNALNGPHDVSRVFGFSHPVGMHLKEYTVAELSAVLRASGFASVDVVVPFPKASKTWVTPALTVAYAAGEKVLRRMSASRRRVAVKALKGPFNPNVWLVAERS